MPWHRPPLTMDKSWTVQRRQPPTRGVGAPIAKAVLLAMTTTRGHASRKSLTHSSPHMTMQDNDTSEKISHMNYCTRMGMQMRTRVPR